MEKEILLESDLEKISGGGYVLMLTKDQYEAVKEAGFVKNGRIYQEDIPGIQQYLKDIGSIGSNDSLPMKFIP